MSSPPTLPSCTPQQAAALYGLRTALGAFGPTSIHSTSIQPGQVPISLYSSSTPFESFADVKNDTKVILHVHEGGGVFGHPADQRFVGFFSNHIALFIGIVGSLYSNAPNPSKMICVC
jgi:hypothetical protein